MSEKESSENQIKSVEYDNIIYQLNNEKRTASVIGSEGNLQEINIPFSINHESEEYTVTIISSNAFENSKIEFIQFASDSKLQTIYEYAFHNSQIKKIRIPSSVTSIGRYAFYNCEQLEVVEIPDDSKLRIIDKFAFHESTIERIRIPSSVTSIGEGAFSFCGEFEMIEIPNDSNLRVIGKNSFSYSSIESFNVPSKLIDLKEGWCRCTSCLEKISVSPKNPRYCLFDEKTIISKTNIEQSNYDCLVFCVRDIRQIKIPNFIKHICSFSFHFCHQLENVEFLNDSKLQTIDKFAFSKAAIKRIRIPSSVTSIGEYAFSYCYQLEVIEIPDDSKLQTIDKDAFLNSKITSIKIPSSATSIGEKTFYFCQQLCIVEASNEKMISMYQMALIECPNVILMIQIHS